jgi:hypothetical protein
MAIFYLFCLFAPFPLWLIEQLLPFPYIIEEIFKFLVVRQIPPEKKYYHPFILGLIFALSESVLYLINFFQLGNFSLFFPRLLFTTTLHITTFSLLYHSRHQRLLSHLSLFLAFFLHFLYNQFVTANF